MIGFTKRDSGLSSGEIGFARCQQAGMSLDGARRGCFALLPLTHIPWWQRQADEKR